MRTSSLKSLETQEIATAVLSGIAAVHERQGQVFICLRTNGRKISSHFHEGGDWRKLLVQAFGDANLGTATSMEIGLSYNWRTVTEFDKSFGEIVKGVRGIRLRAGGAVRTLFPSEMIASNIIFQRLRDRFAAEHPGKQIGTEAFDAFQFILFPKQRQLAKVFRGNQLVSIDEVTRENTTETASLMAAWMANNVGPDGRLTYKYWPSSGEYSSANNTIRQFIGTICLI